MKNNSGNGKLDRRLLEVNTMSFGIEKEYQKLSLIANSKIKVKEKYHKKKKGLQA